MNPPWGPAFQIAYVVPDLEAEIRHWAGTVGVGPFFRLPMPLPVETLTYRGAATTSDDIFGGLAIAYSGDMQIEIIQPGRGRSPYTEFLEAGHYGAHHVGVIADDFDAQLARAKARGIAVTLEATLPMSRLAYLETDAGHPGTVVELVELQPPMVDMLAAFRRASIDWDGRDPIRDAAAIPV